MIVYSGEGILWSLITCIRVNAVPAQTGRKACLPFLNQSQFNIQTILLQLEVLRWPCERHLTRGEKNTSLFGTKLICDADWQNRITSSGDFHKYISDCRICPRKFSLSLSHSSHCPHPPPPCLCGWVWVITHILDLDLLISCLIISKIPYIEPNHCFPRSVVWSTNYVKWKF